MPGKNRRKERSKACIAIVNTRADDLKSIAAGLAGGPFETVGFKSLDAFSESMPPIPADLIIFDQGCQKNSDDPLSAPAAVPPGALWMAVSRDLDYEKSIHAVQNGEIFYFVKWPCPEKPFRKLVQSALDFKYLISLNLPVFTSPWDPHEPEEEPAGAPLPGDIVFNQVTRPARETAGQAAWLEEMVSQFSRHYTRVNNSAGDAAAEFKKINTVARHLAAASRHQIQDMVRNLERIGLSSGLWALSGDGTSKEVIRQCFGLALEKIETRKLMDSQTDELSMTTALLEKAKTDLTDKAFLAGQVQIAASVLHNISNAVTPVIQIIKKINHDEFPQAVEYYKKCVDALYENRENLSWFVNEDKRGRQIFSFLPELAESFHKIEQTRKNLRIQTAEAVSYISQIISLSQSYRSSEKHFREKTSLNHLVEQAALMQDHTFKTRGIEIRRKLSKKNPLILINKNKLWQVLVNLLKNACEAIDLRENSADKHTITLETRSDKGAASLSITDTGIGAEPADIAGMFEYGRSGKGSSGLGLFFCKQFVEENSGTLLFESKGIGTGSCVTITFKSQGNQIS